jgi:hypothetical protein
LTMASTLVVASIARSGAQPNATTSPIPSAILRNRLAVTALMKRFVAEGGLSTAASSTPGKKLRSKIVWTDRAPTGCCFALAPSTCRPAPGLAISLSALKVGFGAAIETLAADRGPYAYLRLEDGIKTTLS